MAFVHLFLFIACFILGKTESALAEFSWHKIKTYDSLKPSPRFAALTWVDSDNSLWLFGGKNVIKSNETETTHLLNDMWKFSPKTFRWYRIASRNTSSPRSCIDGLSCSCGDLAFSFGTRFHENKSLHELWSYNISSNLWHLMELPKNVHDCFVLLCNNNLRRVSLICSNYTSLQMWTFDMKTYQWTSISIPSTEMFRNLLKNVSKSNMHLIWTANLKETVYIYNWSFGYPKNSDLLSITPTNTTITHGFYLHNPGCRTGSVTWMDSASNLHLIGGKKCNSQHVYSDHWMLNITDNNWVSVNVNNPILSHRSYACLWMVGRSLWVYGGYFQNNKGVTKVLSDIWFGNISKHATPILPDYRLPGDTLQLSMVDKLIISGLVLLVVMAVMVRLCYKRELNQMLLQMKRHRVPYHQLSQEGDKTSRL